MATPAKKAPAKKAAAAPKKATAAKPDPTSIKHSVCGQVSNPPPHVIAAMIDGSGPSGLICMTGCSGALRPATEFTLV